MNVGNVGNAGGLALVVVLFGVGSAAADPGGSTGANSGFISKDVVALEIDQCTPDTSISKDELLRRGADYYQRGEVLYLQGDYYGAVKELVESYCEVPFYSILKDIGQAYERQLEYGRAIAYFSRYVLDVPANAKPVGSCAPDPQEDKKNVLARIQVLEKLPAKIRVQATPSDAHVTIVQDSVVEARGTSGDELVVPGGPYQLVVEHDGFHTATREIHPEIGKPYTYFETLAPIKGRIKIQTVPGDARIFLAGGASAAEGGGGANAMDKRLVASGVYDTELPGGKYTVSIEAQDRQTVTKEIVVSPDRDTNLSIELPHQPEFGRKQLLAYATVAGGVAASLISGTQDNGTIIAASALGGLGAGFLGVYYGTDRNLALGTSSLTVTSSLIGGVGGGLVAAMASNSGADVYAPLIGSGLVIGGVAGYLVGDHTHPEPGDAAVINSGALWGTVAGGLFALSFDPNSQIAAGLVASGLGMGTVAGVMLQRYFKVSRGRAALIDASGVVGIVLGLATENLVEQAVNNQVTSSQERTANYALGGLAAGLVLGGVLTRSLDDPKLAIIPTVNKTTGPTGVTTIGVSGAF
ncbi:MAG: tetratricopeptide repeat protein [Kofleriaceae bacterium]